MQSNPDKRGPGRPRSKDTKHRDFTISVKNIQYLEQRKSENILFNMSDFVDQAISEKIEKEEQSCQN